MAPSKARVSDEYNRNDRSITDLQELIDSVRLDGAINSAKVDELAAAIKQKLNVNSMDSQIYTEMAKTFVRFSLKEQNDENTNNSESSSSPVTESPKSPTKSPRMDLPTWSLSSSSPDEPIIQQVSPQQYQRSPQISPKNNASGLHHQTTSSPLETAPPPPPLPRTRSPNRSRRMRSPIRSHRTRSPNRYEAINDNNVRGRSPARSRKPSVPRPSSRSSMDRLFRRKPPKTQDKKADNDDTPQPNKSPLRRRPRSQSPFNVFRKGRRQQKVEDQPASPAPTVYYEAKMNLDGQTPTNERDQRHAMSTEMQTPPSAGRPPLTSVTTDMSQSYLSPPAGMSTRDNGATLPANNPRNLDYNHPTTEPIQPPMNGGEYMQPGMSNGPTLFDGIDATFNIGSAHAPSPRNKIRSKVEKSRQPSATQPPLAEPATNMVFDEDEDYDELPFSPMPDSPTSVGKSQSTHSRSPRQEKGISRSSSKKSGSNRKGRTLFGRGFGPNEAGEGNIRQRSKSPFRRLFNRSPSAKQDTTQQQGNTFRPEKAPITSTSETFSISQPRNVEGVSPEVSFGRRQTAPASTMDASAAKACTGVSSPETPTPGRSRKQDSQPMSAAADNSKNASPLNVAPSVQFQVDLTSSKSLKEKLRNKRAGNPRKGAGVSGANPTAEFQQSNRSLPADMSEDSSSHRSQASMGGSPTEAHNNAPGASSSRRSPSDSYHHTPNFTSGTKTRMTPSLTPMDIDSDLAAQSSESFDTESPLGEIKFSIGRGEKSPSTSRVRGNATRKRDISSSQRGRGSRFIQRHSDYANYPSSSFEESESPLASAETSPVSQDEYGRSYSCNDAQRQAEMDLARKKAVVLALREEARGLYLDGNYKGSILKYTAAIEAYFANCMNEPGKDLFAVLLSNRAAGLLMIGAYAAAAEDCQRALRYVSDPAGYVLSADSGPVLQSKLYTRMARALLKLGEAKAADLAFNQAIDTANNSLITCRQYCDEKDFEKAKQGLNQIITEARLGQTEASRFLEVLDRVTAYSRQAGQTNRANERRSALEALNHVCLALSTASGSESLHQKKVSLLAALKRWREVASHCERFAAANTKFDGAFVDDIEMKHPFYGVPPPTMLTEDYFGETKDEDIAGAEMKLNSKAAAEAILRMPIPLMPYYLRALRIEERYPAAEAAFKSLEGIAEESSGNRLRPEFGWLPRELDKLRRTKSGREKGDDLFRTNAFEQAAIQYERCLTIDAEGIPSTEIDGSTAGGRLHAVLHCNRAACLMALRRFHEAVTECTAALRIHSRYMKALLRRGRCYSRLDRFEESIAEYQRWLDMVQEARRTPLNATAVLTPCLFDGPHEVSDDDIAQVRQELEDVTLTRAKSAAAARAEASFRQQRQKWSKDTFNRNNNVQHEDAQRRRDYFYSQQSTGARRWDSFADRGPKRSNRTNTKGSHQEEQNKKKSSPRNSSKPASAGVPNTNNHYNALQVRNTATEAEIKKAYRKVSFVFFHVGGVVHFVLHMLQFFLTCKISLRRWLSSITLIRTRIPVP